MKEPRSSGLPMSRPHSRKNHLPQSICAHTSIHIIADNLLDLPKSGSARPSAVVGTMTASAVDFYKFDTSETYVASYGALSLTSAAAPPTAFPLSQASTASILASPPTTTARAILPCAPLQPQPQIIHPQPNEHQLSTTYTFLQSSLEHALGQSWPCPFPSTYQVTAHPRLVRRAFSTATITTAPPTTPERYRDLKWLLLPAHHRAGSLCVRPRSAHSGIRIKGQAGNVGAVVWHGVRLRQRLAICRFADHTGSTRLRGAVVGAVSKTVGLGARTGNGRRCGLGYWVSVEGAGGGYLHTSSGSSNTREDGLGTGSASMVSDLQATDVPAPSASVPAMTPTVQPAGAPVRGPCSPSLPPACRPAEAPSCRRRRCSSLLPFLLPALLLALLPAPTAATHIRRLSVVETIAQGNATLHGMYPHHSWHIPVEATDTPHGPIKNSRPHIPFIAAQSDADLSKLYDENLELDLAPWRRRNRREVTVAAMMRWAAELRPKASQRVILIKGGRLAILGQKSGNMHTCDRPCDRLMASMLRDLRTWIAASPKEWPDVVFFLNTADSSICPSDDSVRLATAMTAAATGNLTAMGYAGFGLQGEDEGTEDVDNDGGGDGGAHEEEGGAGQLGAGYLNNMRSTLPLRRSPVDKRPLCPAPVLSLIKEWGRKKDEDILVPLGSSGRGLAPLYYFPWRDKIDRAIFRGRNYCHTKDFAYAKGLCSRTYLAYLSQSNPEWARFMDVGLVDSQPYETPSGTEVRLMGRGFVPLPELARFRYVLALDGITASSRLASLLSLNSVVFRQFSPWIEWYYRSLTHGVHYIGFWHYHSTDLLASIKSMKHQGKFMYDVATHGQAFAYRFLTPNARRLYWLRVLHEYKRLFSDMDAFLAKQVIPPEPANVTYDVDDTEDELRRRRTVAARARARGRT